MVLTHCFLPLCYRSCIYLQSGVVVLNRMKRIARPFHFPDRLWVEDLHAKMMIEMWLVRVPEEQVIRDGAQG